MAVYCPSPGGSACRLYKPAFRETLRQQSWSSLTTLGISLEEQGLQTKTSPLRVGSGGLPGAEPATYRTDWFPPIQSESELWVKSQDLSVREKKKSLVSKRHNRRINKLVLPPQFPQDATCLCPSGLPSHPWELQLFSAPGIRRLLKFCQWRGLGKSETSQ